jgi:uncharacterized protein (DUF58 family)
MITVRGWWFLLSAVLLVLTGAALGLTALLLTGLVLVVWFGFEWLLFVARTQGTLRLERTVLDERGPVDTLWAGQTFTVRVALHLDGVLRWPFLVADDFVPLGVEPLEGEAGAEGEIAPGVPVEWEYRIRCHAAGLARFEGVRVQTADLQGFFYRDVFLRFTAALRVLPVLAGQGGRTATTKRHNLLLPPGIHRLRRPGSGSELLDLRDYLPGDPPKTIAWKVSARRDRLITKEFESEVPVRCTLFVDTSNSVRLAAPPPGGPRHGVSQGKALDRLVQLAAGLLQRFTASRDPAGLCLFDETGFSAVRPDRTGSHLTQMLHRLADAAALGPTAERVHPDHLLPLAYSFAQEVYPDLLRPAVNAVPWWLTWFLAIPSYTRHLRSVMASLFHRKRWLLFGGFCLGGLIFYLSTFGWGTLRSAASALRVHPLALLALLSLLMTFCEIAYVFVLLVNRRRQRLMIWRKRLAALLAVRYGAAGGGLEALMEDDDAFSLLMQRFLNDHRVPYSLPLYNSRGRYRFAAPEKVGVLAGALLRAVGKGHDNELFVLLADLVELDDHLAPLLRAVRVALARHHQVVVICPWPPGLRLPRQEMTAQPPDLRRAADAEVWGLATTARFHAAYARMRRTFARMGVPVVCAEGDEPAALVLERLEQLRMLGRRR